MAFLQPGREMPSPNRSVFHVGFLAATFLMPLFSLWGCEMQGDGGNPGDVLKPGCVDTAGWTDGRTHTCSDYEETFCVHGKFGGEGRFHNYPEKNCCACGKGDSTLTPRPPSPRPRPPSPRPRPPSPRPRPRPSGPKPTNVAWEHFKLVNHLRQSGFTCPVGKSYAPNSVALKFDCRLWRASQLHSQDMADNNYFDHISLDGRNPCQRANAQGVLACGENIAAGRSSAQVVLDQFKDSNAHCENMMNPRYQTFAVGYAFNQGATHKHYWTQMLGRDTTGLDTSCYPTGSELDLSVGAFEANITSPSVAFLVPVINGTLGDAWTLEHGNLTDIAPSR